MNGIRRPKKPIENKEDMRKAAKIELECGRRNHTTHRQKDTAGGTNGRWKRERRRKPNSRRRWARVCIGLRMKTEAAQQKEKQPQHAERIRPAERTAGESERGEGNRTADEDELGFALVWERKQKQRSRRKCSHSRNTVAKNRSTLLIFF